VKQVGEKKRAKCLVCCMRCKLGNHSISGAAKFREGYQTVKFCFQCAHDATPKDQQKPNGYKTPAAKPIPLCTVARFDNDSRTCWEIHHSQSDYPLLACERNHTTGMLRKNRLENSKSRRLSSRLKDEGVRLHRKRSLWNSGEGALIRSVRLRPNVTLHEPVRNDTTKFGRARCIVCCFRCSNEKHGDILSREGYKTTWCCKMCFEDATNSNECAGSMGDSEIVALPLCLVSRFTNDPRSCWDIHHSGDPYPQIPCVKSEKPQKFRWNLLKPSSASQIPISLKHHTPKPNENVKTGRAKCVVCCLRCTNDTHSSSGFREGYKTKWVCTDCPKHNVRKKRMQEGDLQSKEVSEVEKKLLKPIPLCRVPRFKDDPRSCWDIHHSNSQYPALPCRRKKRIPHLFDHRPVRNTSISSGRAKCVVCCLRCTKESHGNFGFREGYKTSWCCYECRKSGPGNPNTNEKPVPLCVKARFNGDPRSCWDIYHSGNQIPQLSCMKGFKIKKH